MSVICGDAAEVMRGSGTTLVAASDLCRDYIGIDESLQYCDTARKRLGQKKLG